MGRRLLRISATLLPRVFSEGKHGGYSVSFPSGESIPPDARVIDAEINFMLPRDLILILESAEWGEIEEGEFYPELHPIFSATDPDCHPLGDGG